MISIISNNDEIYKKSIHFKLRKNNIEKCDWIKNNISQDINLPITKQQNFLAFDEDKLVGGAIGYIEYNWYFLDLMYVDEFYRSQYVGTSLIKKIEEFATNNKLTGVRVETWDFQARGFYEKNGYKVFAQIENCPPGTIDYFLKKEFV
ncbi:MAG: GNAT family N-acetyltransferase [Clostridia bacterium]|nr:GNAT family N-acetyltransferase [Clostridia bacterium]